MVRQYHNLLAVVSVALASLMFTSIPGFAAETPANKPIIIAQRGGGGYLSEHRLEAKVLAHTIGAHFLKQDLVMSKDGFPMVLPGISGSLFIPPSLQKSGETNNLAADHRETLARLKSSLSAVLAGRQ